MDGNTNAGEAPVRVRFLGTGDAFHGGGRRSSSYLVESGAGTLLIDCGPTTPWALASHGIRSSETPIVLITHFHGDHFMGLPFLFLHHQVHDPEAPPMEVIGPVGLANRAMQAYSLAYGGAADRLVDSGRIRFSHLEAGDVFEVRIGLSVEAIAMKHRPESLAYRIEVAGRRLAFTGDTEWCEGLEVLSKDADLLVVDCTDLESGDGHHLSYRELEQRGHLLGARRIILSHLGESARTHAESFIYEVADDGLVVDI